MICFASRPIYLQRNNIITIRTYESNNGTVVFADVIASDEIFQNDVLKADILFIKEEVEKTGAVKPVTFILNSNENLYAYGVDNCQKYVSLLTEPGKYLSKILSSKKDSWMSSMIAATKKGV